MTLLVSRFDESIVLHSEYGVRNFMIRISRIYSGICIGLEQ